MILDLNSIIDINNMKTLDMKNDNEASANENASTYNFKSRKILKQSGQPYMSKTKKAMHGKRSKENPCAHKKLEIYFRGRSKKHIQ